MQTTQSDNSNHAWEIFLVFLRLGCTSFGGPIAHIGYFREEFVTRRGWLGERSFADLVALAQFLPGPSSSQVGLAIGLSRGGIMGAIGAWVGFTLPSAVAMVLFALSITAWGNGLPAGALHALKIVAVAVVAQAVWGMARTLCRGVARMAIMVIAACVLLLWVNPWAQVLVMAFSAIAGMLFFKPLAQISHDPLPIRIGRRAGIVMLGLFFSLLIFLPMIVQASDNHPLMVFSAFFQAGSLVFGGGHVILPLLQAAVVPTGWVSNELFLAGYGAAQAMPGPLFTFAAFLGTVMSSSPNGVLGAGLCLLAVFIPSFLLILGVLPFWESIRANARAQAALIGVNAGVVGLLLAALYDPVWISAIFTPFDFLFALIAFVSLQILRVPPWLVVLVGGVLGGMPALIA